MTSIWDYRDNLDYDLPLEPGDPRLVPLSIEKLEEQGISIEEVYLQRLQDWFSQRIEGSTPIDLLTEQGQLQQSFDEVFRLPMVKLADKGWQSHPAVRTLPGYQEASRALSAGA